MIFPKMYTLMVEIAIFPLFTFYLFILTLFAIINIGVATLKFIPHLPMSKGDYSYYQKVHKTFFMPSSKMFMPKSNSIYYHREHNKNLCQFPTIILL